MSAPRHIATTAAQAQEALQATIEGLYSTFASCPLRPHVVGCTHWVFPEDEARLHSKPLRELTAEDLDKYAFKAMTTWGDEGDFRHFLPRLFELLAFEQLPGCDPEILLGKLDWAGWGNWPEIEQTAVGAYLTSLWQYVLACCPFTDQSGWSAEECLCSIAQAVNDLGPFLRVWRTSPEMSARCHLAQIVDCEGWDNLPDELVSTFWGERLAQMRQVIDWLLEPANVEILRQELESAPKELLPKISGAVEKLAQLQNPAHEGEQSR